MRHDAITPDKRQFSEHQPTTAPEQPRTAASGPARDARAGEWTAALCVAGSVIAPFVTMSLYLPAMEALRTLPAPGGFVAEPSPVEIIADLSACGVAVLLGCLCLWGLPLSVLTRFRLGCVYVPTAAVLVLAYTLWFLSSVYGHRF